MLTLFAIPKAFKGHTEIIQRNAIRSWTLLRPAPAIILLGDEQKTSETAIEFGLTHIPHIARNEFGTPLLNDIFLKAGMSAAAGNLCYINSDIILMDDFMETVTRLKTRKSFLMVGRRWNLEVSNLLEFQSGWQEDLRKQISERGEPETPDGIDYFLFPRGTWEKIPPFAIGRTMWDNWLIFEARRRGLCVIDATESVRIVHQKHDYAHVPTGDAWKGPESIRNVELAGGYERAFTVEDATHRVISGGVRRALTGNYLRNRILRLPVLNPWIGFVRRLIRAVAWRLRKVIQR